MDRNKINERYIWNLNEFCKNREDYYTKLSSIKEFGKDLKKFKGKLGNKKTLRNFLDIENAFEEIVGDAAMYVESLHNTDLSKGEFIEMENLLNQILTDISAETAFVTPELLSYDVSFLEELCLDPEFKNNVLDFKALIREKAHILSEKEEKLLSKMGSFSGEFSEIFHSLDDVDMKFEDVVSSNGKKFKLTNSNFNVYLESADRSLRKSAFLNLYKEISDHENTIATNYIASVKRDWFSADVRGFKSTLEKKLFPDNVNPKVYAALLSAVENNLKLMHEYYKIKKQMKCLKDFTYYDIFAPVVKTSEKAYTIEEAIELVKIAVTPLGKKYVELIEKSLAERWIDVFPTKNKRGGAYSSGVYGRNPLVLLNFEGKLEDVFTLAHELGHALHTYYSNNALPRETADYTIFCAEVASTVNEVLLLKHLFGLAKNKTEKIYYLDKYLKMFRSTLFRQTMFSVFEEHSHNLVEKNLPISKDKLCEFYGELNKKFYGNAVKFMPQISNEWLRIPHFYSSFYVYKYSTGFISAINIASNILRDKNYVEKYLQFLSSGGSDYSVELLKKANVNLETTQPYDAAFTELKWALAELKKLIK